MHDSLSEPTPERQVEKYQKEAFLEKKKGEMGPYHSGAGAEPEAVTQQLTLKTI